MNSAVFTEHVLPVLDTLRFHWILALVGLFSVYFLFGFLSARDALKKLGLPGPTMYPFVGTSWGFWRDKGQMHETFGRYKTIYGDVYALYFLNQPALLVSKPEVLRSILVKEFPKFQDRPRGGLEFPEPLKSMMTSLTGERWKKVRKVLTPTFTSGKLKKVTTTMRKASDTFVEQLSTVADNDKSVDIYRMLQLVTMEVILSSAFGVESSCQANSDDVVAEYARQATSPRMFFQIVMRIPFIGKALTTYMMPTKYGLRYGNLQRVAEKIIAQRKEQSNGNHSDMLGMALEAQHPDSEGMKLTDNEVLAQSLIFLIAGYDTSSIMLGMICYHLAIDQDMQQRLYDEIDAVMGDGPVEYEKLAELVYMEAFMSEVLRLYPPGFIITRLVAEDCVIDGIPFKKDMAVMVPVYNIHRDERYWDEPDTFNPERFLPENASKITPFTYLPFGMGPRNCIGSRFAQLEIKYVIIHMLRKYRLDKGEDLCVPMKMVVKNVLTIGKPVNVRIISRE